MTNREKWSLAMSNLTATDNLIEDFICLKFVTDVLGEACPRCPLGSLCRSYVNEEITFEQYMEKVSEWLGKEVEE